ncbi:MAG: L,D-transpeptidase family protein [Thermodesulfobacteriota bacterium]
MSRKVYLTLSALCGSLLIAFSLSSPLRADPSLAYEIASILQEPGKGALICLGCDQIEVEAPLFEFYARRGFEPLWVSPLGPDRKALVFLETLLDAEQHGLDPQDYHASCLQTWVQALLEKPLDDLAREQRDLAGLDVLLTQAFFLFGEHLSRGRINPAGLYGLWQPAVDQVDVADVLSGLEKDGDVPRAIGELAPPHQGYWALLEEGRRLKKVADEGGWPELPPKIKLQLGDLAPEVALLREQLVKSGDLPDELTEVPELFDDDIETALQMFQTRHGLEPDGVLDGPTTAELNVPALDRWRQVMLNMERWRWLPRDLGRRYVMVNPTSFSLKAYEGGNETLEMRVVVGKVATQTPVFSEVIRYIEINPFWYVPRSIAVKMNKNKLSGRGYATFGSSGIVQYPGPGNALGRIKFVFPNRFSVYMHDTPSKHLFEREYRAYSHGCIRLQKPIDLAVFLMQDDLDWTSEKVKSLIRTGATQRIPVEQDSKVHVVYFTAWVDEEGVLQFRNDLYHRDPALRRVLFEDRRLSTVAARAGHEVAPGPCGHLTAANAPLVSTR